MPDIQLELYLGQTARPLTLIHGFVSGVATIVPVRNDHNDGMIVAEATFVPKQRCPTQAKMGYRFAEVKFQQSSPAARRRKALR
jgi:hypothetical protein